MDAPALPSYLPARAGVVGVNLSLPQRTPVAPFAMQRILTKAIRSHGKSTNLHNFKVKGADKMGGKRGSSRGGRAARGAGKTAGRSSIVGGGKK